MTQANLLTENLRCKICGREGELTKGHVLCPGHAALVEIVRRNLEGAAKSTLPPPKEIPPCDARGGPQKPILFRPEGPWTFYCLGGCHYCRVHHTIHTGAEGCAESVRRGLTRDPQIISESP